jgi:hypothetical protein
VVTYKDGSWTGYQSATGLSNPASGKITVVGDTSAGTLSFYLNGTLLNHDHRHYLRKLECFCDRQ